MAVMGPPIPVGVTDDEKAALQGTTGTPSAANKYVTDSDPRLSGGGGGTPWKSEEFTPTLGQITFIAVSIPTDPLSVEFYVNGVLQDEGGDYTRSGSTFTFLNPNGSLDGEDHIIIRYQ